MNDQRLIEKCVARDCTAWDEFARCYYRLVLKCVRYKLRSLNISLSRALADDITQEVFTMLWESDRLSSVRNYSSIRGWLAIVSMNFTSSIMQTKNFRNDQKNISLDSFVNGEENFSLMSGLSNDNFLSPIIPGESQNNIEIEHQDLRKIIKKEISKLVPKQALALKLNLLDGRSQKDIAQLLKIPENTVATIIRRGKSRLAKRLRVLMKTNI